MNWVDLYSAAELLRRKKLQWIARCSQLASEFLVLPVDRLVIAGKQKDTNTETEAFGAKESGKYKLSS
jgi:hypothetical protein